MRGDEAHICQRRYAMLLRAPLTYDVERPARALDLPLFSHLILPMLLAADFTRYAAVC